jgi:hypothetical protein
MGIHYFRTASNALLESWRQKKVWDRKKKGALMKVAVKKGARR